MAICTVIIAICKFTKITSVDDIYIFILFIDLITINVLKTTLINVHIDLLITNENLVAVHHVKWIAAFFTVLNMFDY